MEQGRIEIGIAKALRGWVALVLRRRAITIVVVILLAALSAGFAFQNLGINTDTANMMRTMLPMRLRIRNSMRPKIRRKERSGTRRIAGPAAPYASNQTWL